MKQSAVDWLWDLSRTKELEAKDFEEAKRMEKEDIKLRIQIAYNQGRSDGYNDGVDAFEQIDYKSALEYYNENY